MKILIIGDMHYKKQNIPVIEELLTKCKKLAKNCDLTVFTGDLNDQKSTLSSYTIDSCLKMFKDWPTEIIVYTGNHDVNSAMDPQGGHSLQFLSLLDNISIISIPMLYRDMMFVPYLTEENWEQKANLQKAEICFIHNDVIGASYSNQSQVNSSIDPILLKDYKKVFAEHIHKKQQIGNIIFVGTPYTESFKESDENKRVIVYDTETDKVLEIPLGVRRHMTFKYTIAELKDLKDVKADLKLKLKPNILARVVIDVPEEIEHKVKKSLFKDLNIETLKTNKIKDLDKKVTVTENMSNSELMTVYLNQMDLSLNVRSLVDKWNEKILKELS